jgi:ribosome-associated protein
VLDQPVRLRDAATLVGLSPGRTRHLFVQHTGLPFRTWLLWHRLVRALEGWSDGDSLTEAAHAAGFADSAHLSRTFRRNRRFVTGVSSAEKLNAVGEKPGTSAHMAAKKKITKTSAKKKPVAKKKSPAKKSAPKKAAARTSAPASRKKTTTRAKPPLKTRRPAVRAKRPAPKKKVAAAGPKVAENAAALELARTIAHLALEKKALDVVVIDTRVKGSQVGYDYVVIASGESDRQLDAIANSVDDTLRAKGKKTTSIESSPDWVLVNYDDVVAHFFTPDKRGAYDLEGMWHDAPRVALR